MQRAPSRKLCHLRRTRTASSTSRQPPFQPEGLESLMGSQYRDSSRRQAYFSSVATHEGSTVPR